MQAIVQDAYGGAEVLRLDEVARPDASNDEVLVRVVAAGVDRGALHLMTGVPYLMRILGFGLRAPKTRVPGTNIAGRVEAVGKNATRFKAGDEVYGTCKGAFAEYACAREDKLAPKPARLTFEQAAVLPYPAFAALQALRDRGKVQPGQKVLIVGASGAVGTIAVQLAKAFGGEVTGVGSASSFELMQALGADHVIDYAHDDFADGNRAYDLIVDIAGNSSVSRLRRALEPQGRLVIVGGEGGRVTGIDRQIRAHMLSPFVGQKLGTFVVRENAADLSVMNDLVESGKVAPIVGHSYALKDTPEAIRALQTGSTRGRIAITV